MPARFKRPTIIFRTIAFVAIVCISLVAIDAWNNWKARSVQLR